MIDLLMLRNVITLLVFSGLYSVTAKTFSSTLASPSASIPALGSMGDKEGWEGHRTRRNPVIVLKIDKRRDCRNSVNPPGTWTKSGVCNVFTSM